MCLKRINWFKMLILKESFPWRTLHKMLKLYEKWLNGEIVIHKLHIEQNKIYLFIYLKKFFKAAISCKRASLVAQMVKNLPAMWKTRVQSLGWEDLLEKGMASHCSILAWRILWTEEPGGLHPMRLQTVGYDWGTTLSLFTFIRCKP